MDTGRDLACPTLWQESLERSLARRGRSTRSSLELFQLRAERDLSRPELLSESLMYSQLRRSAVPRRPAMAVPSAGGISALALLAAATLPGLVGGRGSGRAGGELTVAGATGRTRLAEARVRGAAVNPALGDATTHPAPPSTGVRTAAPASVPTPGHARAAAPHPAVHPRHITTAPSSSSHYLASPGHATASRHAAAAHDAAARVANGGVAHALSGGAAPSARRHSAVAPRVPAKSQPSGHPSMGGGAKHKALSVRRPPTRAAEAGGVRTHAASKPAHAPATRHPVTASRLAITHPATATHQTTPAPATVSHPAASHPATLTHQTAPQPAAVSQPTAATHSPPKAPAPAPAPAPSGRYVNPLAGASVTPERIDQGVDYSGSGTLGAIGDGKVTYVGTSGTGWPGAFVEYQLTSGSYAGRFVYYAESITPAGSLHVGQTVQAGQPIASAHGGIEIGWGSGVGTQTLAQALGQWAGGDDASNVASPPGKSFSALVAGLGGPPGKVEG